MGGVLFQLTVGYVVEATGSNYNLIFIFCGVAYVSALMHYGELQGHAAGAPEP
jgi:nitrate/nitrite transporter NarK